MERDAGMAGQPALHGGRLVRAVIVEDQMEVEMSRCLAVDLLQEAQELGGSMARLAIFRGVFPCRGGF